MNHEDASPKKFFKKSTECSGPFEPIVPRVRKSNGAVPGTHQKASHSNGSKAGRKPIKPGICGQKLRFVAIWPANCLGPETLISKFGISGFLWRGLDSKQHRMAITT